VRYTAVEAPRGYGCTDPAPRVTVVECTAARPDALPTGQDLTFTLTLFHDPQVTVAPSLTHRVTVDPANAVAERDEGNNAAAQTVPVRAADLRVAMISSPLLIPAGGRYDFPVFITNTGTAPATIPAGVLLLRVELDSLFVESYTASVPEVVCTVANAPVDQLPGIDRAGNPTVYNISRPPNGRVDCVTTQTLVIDPGTEIVFAFMSRVYAWPRQLSSHDPFTALAWLDTDEVIPELSNIENAGPGIPPGQRDNRDNLVTDGGGFADFG
jgi:hypothetical protein